MSKRGRKKTPVVLRKLRGNPGKRRMPVAEPEGVGSLWSPPRYFDAAARAEWQYVIDNAPRGLLTATDRAAVEVFVNAVVEYRRAMIAVRSEGQIVKTPNGAVIQHPALGIAHRSSAIILKFGSSLGMTPTARAAIGSLIDNAGASNGESSLAEYIRNKPDSLEAFIANNSDRLDA